MQITRRTDPVSGSAAFISKGGRLENVNGTVGGIINYLKYTARKKGAKVYLLHPVQIRLLYDGYKEPSKSLSGKLHFDLVALLPDRYVNENAAREGVKRDIAIHPAHQPVFINPDDGCHFRKNGWWWWVFASHTILENREKLH